MPMFNIHTRTAKAGACELEFQTGLIARQADGSIIAKYGDVVVMANATASRKALQGANFLPLTVHYQERTYAAGRFLGGFFKREGRPSEKEVLTSRLIDRPFRPLFPKGFFNEVQVVATVISADEDNNPDVVAINAVSAALAISGILVGKTIGASRVAYIDGQFILNPSYDQMELSKLDLVVAGTKDAVLMVESEAEELSEELMLDAIMFGHAGFQGIITAIDELAADVDKPALEVTLAQAADIGEQVAEQFEQALRDAYSITDKQLRSKKVEAIREQAQQSLVTSGSEDGTNAAITANDVSQSVKQLEKHIVRRSILAGNPRIDGRSQTDIRPIDCRVGILPRTHGSALFTRGETQALVTVTLGTESDRQLVENLEGVSKERFMLHYNFPPYSVGEVRRMGPPGRREIGHGRLAKRALMTVLPSDEEFAYAIRVVSEITESNGSSSMASVCGGTLAMMDAGVPLRKPVSGIAMGLILEDDGHAILSDILGDEDHLGDMDFKVAGTRDGVTTLQLDIKIGGLTRDIMQQALAQANTGRIHILNEIEKCLTTPRKTLADHAPRITTLKINPDKIRDIIGPGGKIIRGIVEETGAKIDIEDDGSVKIFASTGASGDAARARIEEITAEAEVGAVYEGPVVKITDFGAFIRLFPGTDGLVHISQIANHRVKQVSDELKEGEVVRVKVLDVDSRNGRIRLSMKALLGA
ncbi:MAG: polyribonucleotide nucleotidyltransferase [Mariprofundales bacterium]